MPRYLTFDEKTASALRTQVPDQQVFEHGAEGAVDYALHSDRDIVAVMPAGAARRAAIAVFRKRQATLQPAPAANSQPDPKVQTRKPVASVPMEAKHAASIRAGGFLGLRDEPVFDEEPVAPRKQSWWRKLWPEDE